MNNIKIINIILVIIFVHFSITSAKNSEDIDKLRKTYYAGVENEDYIDSLEVILYSTFGSDTSLYSAQALAYLAGAEALKSKHAFWPFTKMTYLNESMDIFERAVELAPQDLEIRFMRFSILYYVPGILGYSNEKEKDLEVIYHLLLEQKHNIADIEILKGIVRFIIESELLEEHHTASLSKKFPEVKLDG